MQELNVFVFFMCKRYIPEIYVTLTEFRKPVKAG